jgi:hypothetical protein
LAFFFLPLLLLQGLLERGYVCTGGGFICHPVRLRNSCSFFNPWGFQICRCLQVSKVWISC